MSIYYKANQGNKSYQSILKKIIINNKDFYVDPDGENYIKVY